MNISGDVWTWIGALGIIAMFSFIFKENPIYRWCEHLYVGTAAGYAIAVNAKSAIDKAWTPLVQDGKVIMIIPMIFGLLMYARFIKNIAWLSRWPMSFLVGVGSGLAIYGVVNSQLLAQIKASLVPLNSINNIIMVLGLLSILLYFFFSMEHEGPVKYGATFGRWIMMITFGVSFGNVVMGRISLLLGTLETILGNWLGLL